MDSQSTGILGQASTIRINYQIWAGLLIDTTDPSHFVFHVWYSFVA